MRQLRIFATCCGIIVLATASWIFAQQKTSKKLTAEDHVEIQQLYQSYQRGVDGGPRDSSWVFTSDGEFVNGGRTISGESQLKTFYANVRKTHSAPVRHLLSNIVINQTPDGASGSAYLFTVDVPDSGKPAMIVYYGVYDDTLVKTAAGWRIKRRVYSQDWTAGAPQRH